MFDSIIFYTFIISAGIQLFYWLFIFSRLAFFESLPPQHSAEMEPHRTIPVSVIICARNEAENLKKNLPLILNQDYASFEIIVANDASTDDTLQVLELFAQSHAHLKIVNITEKKIKGKKGVLAAAIEAAQNDWLLMTDADCYPLSNQWIFDMINGVYAKEIGLGYAPYEKRDGFLNKFIRFETVWTAIQYMSFALAGEPYMGVGRNMIYKKKLYLEVGGFQKHQHIASGDDDLFINSVITKKNFKIILRHSTFMCSLPNTRWNAYFTQKKRHLSTSTSYILRHKIMLGLLSLSHFLFFVTAVWVLALKISTIFALTIIVVRTLIVWYFYGKILRRFHETNLSIWIPFLDVVYIFFYIIFLPALTIRTQKW